MQDQIKNGIKGARQKMRYSEIDLAYKMNIEPSVLKAWELGAITPTVESIKNLSILLNVSADSLLFSENRKPLSLEGLKKEEKYIIRMVYESIKDK